MLPGASHADAADRINFISCFVQQIKVKGVIHKITQFVSFKLPQKFCSDFGNYHPVAGVWWPLPAPPLPTTTTPLPHNIDLARGAAAPMYAVIPCSCAITSGTLLLSL
jgi:hypothetical protein